MSGRRARSPRDWGAVLRLALGLLAAGRAVAQTGASPEVPAEVPYVRQVLETPRPHVAHVLTVDLTDGAWVPAVAVAPDPDGDGPAQSQLADPLRLAQDARLEAAVNANVFSLLPGTPSDEPLVEGLPVLLNGLAVTRDRVVARPRASRNLALWWDADGRPHLGYPSPREPVREGVSGYGWLVRNGVSVPPEDGKLHPRTAAALDPARKTLWLVVVDGRQPGYSEGVSLRELAEYLRALGAWNAINLDGGGSSAMLVVRRDGRPELANRPATLAFFRRVARPVPVLLGIRRAPPAGPPPLPRAAR